MLRSFWRHFPNKDVLVIDNNHEPTQESIWLKDQERIIYKPFHSKFILPPSYHDAKALDYAVTLIKKEFMIVVHPDCIITGRSWIEEIFEKHDGLDFVFLKSANNIPCGSLIRISAIKDLSFKPKNIKGVRKETAFYIFRVLLDKDKVNFVYGKDFLHCNAGITQKKYDKWFQEMIKI